MSAWDNLLAKMGLYTDVKLEEINEEKKRVEKIAADKLAIKKEEAARVAEEERIAFRTPEQIRRDHLAEEKRIATEAKEPWVAVLDTQVNSDNVRNGFFELDWNEPFIEQLLDHGYMGNNQEEIVDKWYRSLIMQMLDEDGMDPTRDSGHIKIKSKGDGKSEVS
jgi:hypothetical protein|tara:strand:+ start:5535 stop:6026 length:492 start_codon:yes stop_codon:yes gene_type:complete